MPTENKKNLDKTIDNLLDYLYGVQKSSMETLLQIFNEIEQDVSTKPNMYATNLKMIEYRKNVKEELFNLLNTSNDYLYRLIENELESPFSTINMLLETDATDYILHRKIIKVEFGSEFYSIKIPEDVQKTFNAFLVHFLNMQKFMNGGKLDRSSSILDTTYGPYRLNMLHESLSSVESPTVAIRKHTMAIDKDKSDLADLDEMKYFESIGASEKQIQLLLEADKRSICVFGVPGSGKTTLLRFVANHDLDKKRNLCVIEDAAELGLDVPISLVTNNNYSIHDLFVSSLRFKPSHMIIGETRTDEIVDIMETSLTFPLYTTIHASTFDKALERIFFMSMPRKLEKKVIDGLIASAIDIFVLMEDRKLIGLWVRNDEQAYELPVKEKYDEVQ